MPPNRGHLKRLALPLALAMLIIVLFACTASFQALQLFLLKALLVCAGFALAHLLRVIAFPYINFCDSTDREHKLLVVGLYLVCVWAFAIGG